MKTTIGDHHPVRDTTWIYALAPTREICLLTMDAEYFQIFRKNCDKQACDFNFFSAKSF